MTPKKIFLSYKSSDPKDKKSAKRIKEILEGLSRDAVQVFASDESIHAGDNWRPVINKEINEADYLIFLYTDRHANWDWCHFEAGLFLKTAPESVEVDKRRIFCIHPASVGDPPSPLGTFQHIKLPDALESLVNFLVQLFVGDDPIRKLWFDSNSERIRQMATDISDEVGRMAVTSLQLCRYITLRGKTQPNLDLPSDGGTIAQAIPDSYIVETDEASLKELFGKAGTTKSGAPWTWGEVKPDGQDAWVSELATAMARYIRNETTPHPIRSSFKSPKGLDYKPILSKVNRRPDEYSFHVLFLAQSWEGGTRTDAVSSFKELMERLVDLVKSTEQGDTIRFLAYTPAVGFLAETEELWEKLRNCMWDRADEIDMICLDDDDLVRWHGLFAGKKTARSSGFIDAPLIQKANAVSTELFNRSKAEGRHPKRKAFSELPGFYLFKNSKRALIVAPVGVPLVRDADGASIKKELTESKVEMFGLDTNVPQIVKNAGLTFERFR
jgi:hypothetical protein